MPINALCDRYGAKASGEAGRSIGVGGCVEDGEYFRDSQFLVLMNRALALLLAAALLVCTRGTHPTHRAPYAKYIPASLSNTFSRYFSTLHS